MIKDVLNKKEININKKGEINKHIYKYVCI